MLLSFYVRLQKYNNQDCTKYEVVSDTNLKQHEGKKHSQTKGGDISMVQCQAYGEVGLKKRASDREVNQSSGLYEDI